MNQKCAKGFAFIGLRLPRCSLHAVACLLCLLLCSSLHRNRCLFLAWSVSLMSARRGTHSQLCSALLSGQVRWAPRLSKHAHNQYRIPVATSFDSLTALSLCWLAQLPSLCSCPCPCPGGQSHLRYQRAVFINFAFCLLA